MLGSPEVAQIKCGDKVAYAITKHMIGNYSRRYNGDHTS